MVSVAGTVAVPLRFPAGDGPRTYSGSRPGASVRARPAKRHRECTVIQAGPHPRRWRAGRRSLSGRTG